MKYNLGIAKAIRRYTDGTRLLENDKNHYKAGCEYRIERRDKDILIYHYGQEVGGVRIDEGGKHPLICELTSNSDIKALNTAWKVCSIGLRARMEKGYLHIDKINECSDNYEV